MRRKVVKQGPATFMVSLPAKWVRENHVQRGQELEVRTDGPAIHIFPGELEPEKKRQEFSFEAKQEKYIYAVLRKAYRLGCDEVVVRFSTDKAINFLERATARLVGADIIDLENKRCKIIITNPETCYDLDAEMAKIMYRIIEQVETIKSDLSKNKFARFDKVNDLDFFNLTKINYLIRTAYIQRASYEKFSVIHELLTHLHGMSRQIAWFYKIGLLELKSVNGKIQITQFINELLNLLRSAVKKIQSKKTLELPEDFEFRDRITNFQTELLSAIDKKKITGALLVFVYYISNKLDNLVEYLDIYKS